MSSAAASNAKAPAASAASAAAAAAAGGGGRTGLVWFKCSDLRCLDHEPLLRAHEENARVLHLFCFDPRWCGPVDDGAAAPGTLKTGALRGQFLLEAVEDLRARLRAQGSDLVVKLGRPEVEVPKAAAAVGARAVYAHRYDDVHVHVVCVREGRRGGAVFYFYFYFL
jgi:deoxyribodipyrimidine photolyase